MKSLVLLYRTDDEVTIREYSKVEEMGTHYILGKTSIGKEGILKKYVGEVCKWNTFGATCKGASICRYPIGIPYMKNMWWDGGYFMFVNKTKYDANPSYYYDIIKNYREE